MCSASLHLLHLGLAHSLKASSQPYVSRRASASFAPVLESGCSLIKRRIGEEISLQRCGLRNSFFPVVAAIDEDFGDISFSLENDGVYGGSPGYIISSSEGEDSDIDAFLTPFAETDLPTSRERLETPNAALTLSAHRLATIQKGYRKNRTRRGVILTLGLTAFLVVFGMLFSIWLESTDLPTPYSMKLLVPLPPPYGLVHLGKCYPLLTLFCFVVMPNGVHLTDRADGLVGGVSALAFVGMSIAVLPICPELAVFGASMAGASVGFLFHNRYKASILLGGVGSLGLGGALSAMAACTGMFFPLFISSGVFILEALSIVLQVIVLKATVRRKGAARLVSRVAPLQQQLKLYGVKVPLIVASAYVLSSILAIFAGYVGLISA